MYFRHGAKSEPATSDDLRAFIDRELELIKRSWLDGISKVVEAPAGSRIAILPPETQPTGPSGAVPLQLTNDPNAPAYYAVPASIPAKRGRSRSQRTTSRKEINHLSRYSLCASRVLNTERH